MILNLLIKFRNYLSSYLFKLELIESAYKQQHEQITADYIAKIEEHKLLCIDYVKKMKKLHDGQRQCDLHFRYAAARTAWITEMCLQELIPDDVQRKALWLKSWEKYIRQPIDSRCSWCTNDPIDKPCLRCLRGQTKPTPTPQAEIDKLIQDVDAALSQYNSKILNSAVTPNQSQEPITD